METFLSNFLASIVAGIVIIIGAALFSKKAKWIFTGLVARLMDIDIDSVYESKKEAQHDLRADFKKSKHVAILTGRGNEFQRDTFGQLFSRALNNSVHVRILLPETSLKHGEYDWTMQRDEEVAKFDQAFGKGVLGKQININVEFLQKYLESGEVELRRFNYPHIGRIIITEKYAYFSPYLAHAHGRDAKIYKYRRGGEMYENYQRLFEQLWTAGESSESQASQAG
ncbi:hypothetical protein QUF72_13010 [Desulfobacterales bacterium HSG2]|nr:hypothetical protein [Desulfobacterales bacterium HSG2]